MSFIEKYTNILLEKTKLGEALQDYAGNTSYGRLSGLLCLVFSQAIALGGLFFPENEKVLSYCSTISLQFLGAAVAFYIPSKASEAYIKKWSPKLIEAVAKVSPAETISETIGDTTEKDLIGKVGDK